MTQSTHLVIAEHDGAALTPATLTVVTAALAVGGAIHIAVFGHHCGAVAAAAAQVEGVAQVLCADAPEYAHGLAETLAPAVVALADAYTHLWGAANTFGKNLMPRVAALLDVQPISDVIAVLGPETFQRPNYAGNAIATVKAVGNPRQVLTVRTTAFAAAVARAETAAPIETVAGGGDPGLSAFVSAETVVSDRPDLTTGRIVVSGGRGLQSKENFALLERLATKLGAALGASRAAVDAGFAPNDWQVGQTGKMVAPDLYIAIGISGAIQHLAGMKDSKVIVAINKDPEAPIFQVADYGLVADLFQAVPELEAALSAA